MIDFQWHCGKTNKVPFVVFLIAMPCFSGSFDIQNVSSCENKHIIKWTVCQCRKFEVGVSIMVSSPDISIKTLNAYEISVFSGVKFILLWKKSPLWYHNTYTCTALLTQMKSKQVSLVLLIGVYPCCFNHLSCKISTVCVYR